MDFGDIFSRFSKIPIKIDHFSDTLSTERDSTARTPPCRRSPSGLDSQPVWFHVSQLCEVLTTRFASKTQRKCHFVTLKTQKFPACGGLLPISVKIWVGDDKTSKIWIFRYRWGGDGGGGPLRRKKISLRYQVWKKFSTLWQEYWPFEIWPVDPKTGKRPRQGPAYFWWAHRNAREFWYQS